VKVDAIKKAARAAFFICCCVVWLRSLLLEEPSRLALPKLALQQEQVLLELLHQQPVLQVQWSLELRRSLVRIRQRCCNRSTARQ